MKNIDKLIVTNIKFMLEKRCGTKPVGIFCTLYSGKVIFSYSVESIFQKTN